MQSQLCVRQRGIGVYEILCFVSIAGPCSASLSRLVELPISRCCSEIAQKNGFGRPVLTAAVFL